MGLNDQNVGEDTSPSFGLPKSSLSDKICDFATEYPVASGVAGIAMAYALYRAGQYAVCKFKPSSEDSNATTAPVQTRQDETPEEREERTQRKNAEAKEETPTAEATVAGTTVEA